MFGYMIFFSWKISSWCQCSTFFLFMFCLIFVIFSCFFMIFHDFFMIFHVFFFKKMNQQVQVWCKFAANLHQTCTPSFVFFCFFILFFNMFFYMFLFMWFIVFLWKPFGISGQQMDYNSMCPGFLNTIYIYIIWLPQHYFPNQKVTCISNMWVENAQWQLPTQAPNSIFFLKKLIYIYFF